MFLDLCSVLIFMYFKIFSLFTKNGKQSCGDIEMAMSCIGFQVGVLFSLRRFCNLL